VIHNFINDSGSAIETKVLSHAAVGGELVLKGRSICAKKASRIWTTSDRLKQSLQGLSLPVSRNGLEFVECGGALTKQTSTYPLEMFNKVWVGLSADFESKRPRPALVTFSMDKQRAH
jgi:hypothetical protein